jgi:hypothetical protein
VERVSNRVAYLLDEQTRSLSQAKIVDAGHAVKESQRSSVDPAQRNDISSLSYARVIGELPPPQHAPPAPRRRSALCKQADFSLDAYRYWIAAMKQTPKFHRKQWEFFYIAQALHERGLLDKGRSGLGFGVGREPLPALFASFGCTVVATDQAQDGAIVSAWQESGEHADSLAALEKPEICSPATFRQYVSFEPVDMNNIPERFADQFDFCWSACCFEHLGSLEHGLRFVENSLKVLKIGGVAVHTTEFNLSSDTDTFETPGLSIYRTHDIVTLINHLEQAGHRAESLDLDKGTTLIDGYVDLPPYSGEPHLRLRLAGYDCTSIGLIITRVH